MTPATPTNPTCIVVELENVTERYTRIEESVPLLKKLAGTYAMDRAAFAESRRRLGAALVQIRGQVMHGQWLRFVADLAATLGLNKHSLLSAITVAETLCTRDGSIDHEKVAKAQTNTRNSHRGENLTPPEKMSMRQLEELAGRRPSGYGSLEELTAKFDAAPAGVDVVGVVGEDDGADDLDEEEPVRDTARVRLVGGCVDGDVLDSFGPEIPEAPSLVLRAPLTGEQFVFDGIYAEVGSLMRRVAEAALSPEQQRAVEAEMRESMGRVRAICGW